MNPRSFIIIKIKATAPQPGFFSLSLLLLHSTEGKLWVCGLAQPESTYVIPGRTQVVVRLPGLIFFFFSQVWLWDTPNLLTHIHHTLLCAGLKCVWERERQEKRTPSVCYVMLNGWKKNMFSGTASAALRGVSLLSNLTLSWLSPPPLSSSSYRNYLRRGK